MKTQLVTLETDTTPLDGALHEPDGGATAGGVLLFHGNTMNFYTGAPRFLPPALTAMGYACLAFNRRGHDIMSIRDSRSAEGAAFQKTAEAIEDNRIAARWMADRGFPDPVVIGHSNGGMLAVRHVADHPETPALVLLSAHGGGDQVRRSSGIGLLAGDRFAELVAEAQSLIDAGRGQQLMLLPGWWYVTTAESFIDRVTQLPDVLALAPEIRCPSLFVVGDEEPADLYPAERFAARAGGPSEARILDHCNHFYVGREAAVTDTVVEWLGRTLRPAAVRQAATV